MTLVRSSSNQFGQQVAPNISDTCDKRGKDSGSNDEPNEDLYTRAQLEALCLDRARCALHVQYCGPEIAHIITPYCTIDMMC
jgi:hypothetical protein